MDDDYIEDGYVYESDMGRIVDAHKATEDDYKYFKWCTYSQPWDHKERCGDKPLLCLNGKLQTWDPVWKGWKYRRTWR